MPNYQPCGIDADDYLAPTPLQQHNAAVRAVLLDRAPAYGDNHMVASVCGAMSDAVTDALPKLTPAQYHYIYLICYKAARSIVGGLRGNYCGDNGHDSSAYEALLAALSSGATLAEVLGK